MIFRNKDKELDKKRKLKETDSFWDISAIVPFKKKAANNEKKREVGTVTVVDESNSSYVPVTSAVAEPIKRPEDNSELVDEYVPENQLIKNISVFSWPSRYTFYERFRLDAHRFFETDHPKTQPIDYFSYMPSYMQMSLKQREWYFYWRSCVRKKVYMPTSSSYILLYVYEIINLPDLIEPKEGVVLLCEIWEKYRKTFTKLDRFMSEWLCDYCLINRLELPIQHISSFYGEALRAASFKQFYIKSDKENVFADLLFEKTSSYDWRKSKYITDSNREVFETHIKNAFRYAIKKYERFDGRFAERLIEKKVARDSFSGALCVYNVKKKIEVSYYDIVNVGELGFIVTDMIIYCENKIRAYFGVRYGKSVQNLTEQEKAVIDEYFDAYLPSVNYKKQHTKNKEAEEYKITEEKGKPFSVSFDRAKEIEQESWKVTDRLVFEESEQEDISDVKPLETQAEKSVEGETLDVAKAALACIAKKDMAGFFKIADECYMLPETLAECVNELCFELFGDIGIEEHDGEYRVISEYEQEVMQWLRT